jgi:citrate synthase
MYNMLMRDSGFEPDIIPAAMLAHRIIGIMAHWREYTGMDRIQTSH